MSPSAGWGCEPTVGRLVFTILSAPSHGEAEGQSENGTLRILDKIERLDLMLSEVAIPVDHSGRVSVA